MLEAGSFLLADIMLWLMYIVVAVAVGTMLFSAARSFWLDNHSRQ
jgi:hypothetical protein